MADETTEQILSMIFASIILFFLLMVIQWILQSIYDKLTKSKLPNHILYFKSTRKQMEQDIQNSFQRGNKQSLLQSKGQIQFSKIEKYLPPQVTPFGDQAISEPNQSSPKVQFTHPQQVETNFAKTQAISPKKAPKTSSLLEKIQKDAEKLHDETKKADKETKQKEKEEREKRKQQEKEDLKKKQEEASAAQQTQSTGLGIGGLKKGSGASLSSTKLALKTGSSNASNPPATETAQATEEKKPA